MSYKALYRTYRPKDFNDVAGQKHITQTLKNALANNKVAHAYLFSGPRGTGKTSIAKILAKAINCKESPTENPCNVCENCLGIQDGSISDVIEIDAASNNGVDEIRELRDKVKYLPGYVNYKVYIIDEVHMLSQGAFNALLKTLEEPPKHVIFILCTTELQKVIPTIQSRCQRFDFKAISTNDIILKLNEIIKQEKIDIEENAIKQIAIYAEGGLRDAISLLDQVYSYNPGTIELEDVNQICGAVSLHTQMDLAKALIQKDSPKAISLLNDLLSQGKEIKKITINLIEFFRDTLMYSNLESLDESSLLYKNLEFQKIAKDISNRKAFHIIDILNKALNEINWSNNPKIHLELAFLKIADNEEGSNSNVMTAIDKIEKRIVELESLKQFLENKDEIEKKEIVDAIIKDRHEENKVEDENDIVNNPIEEPIEEETTFLEDNQVEETIVTSVNQEVPEVEIQELEPIIEEDSIEQPTVKENLEEDISKTYNIDFVEEVLNNGDRQDKVKLQNEWSNFPEVINEEDSKYLASLLEAGKVMASSYDKIIITFASTTICNTLMIPKNKEIVMKIINGKFNRIINYMALPNSVFSDISKEFLDRYRMGEKYVRLSRIVCDSLKDVSQVEQKNAADSKPKIVKDAFDLFGDLVKIKE